MAGEWTEVSIEQIATKIAMGPFGSDIKTDNFVPTGVPVIRGGNLTSGRFHGADFVFLTEEKARQLANSNAFPGDLVFTHRGTLGQVGLVPAEPFDRYVVSQSQMLLRCDPSAADSAFIYYFFKSDVGQHALLMNTSQTGVPAISRPTTSLKGIRLSLPPLPEQRAIAHILGALDDKIELNRRINETLEAMARALFKSWFVDFDPVRAKAEGCDPGLPRHLADLFPARLVDTELGEIPEGWDEGSFGSFISQRSERVGGREVVVLSAVANGKLARSDDHFTKRVYSKETAKYLLVEQWDFAYNPSRINIGSIGMLEDEIVGGVSPVYVVARPRPVYRWFLEFSIRRAHTKTWINTLASGSVRQSLSYTDFASIPCVVPPEAVAQEFNRLWSTWRDGIRSHEAEIRILADLRDSLLPALISGEFRLKDVEKFVGRAV